MPVDRLSVAPGPWFTSLLSVLSSFRRVHFALLSMQSWQEMLTIGSGKRGTPFTKWSQHLAWVKPLPLRESPESVLCSPPFSHNQLVEAS